MPIQRRGILSVVGHPGRTGTVGTLLGAVALAALLVATGPVMVQAATINCVTSFGIVGDNGLPALAACEAGGLGTYAPGTLTVEYLEVPHFLQHRWRV